ncbi:MAG: TIM barrel protein [Aurantimonas endophytica]|uniref:hydroxypyruvate isomerase family protein n=1 Tax=Aurantimonas endophytica TaxID=1522175 RepID=UPI003002C42E
MPRFSANLGFLWTEMGLPDAIRRAHRAGFAAVECHWPYDEDSDAVRAALDETGLPMLGINTRKGPDAGDFGLAALPGREAEAHAAIDEAFAYGAAIGASAVHVMAGKSLGLEGAAEAFEANLHHACDLAAGHGMTVLIEPLNHRDAPGYFLVGIENAAAIVARVGRPELKIMFDCYHTQITQGDLLRRFEAHRALIGHVQIAAAPSRAEPDEGEIAYDWLLPAIDALGYDGYVGAEYRPRAGTDEGLGWLDRMQAA